LIHNAILDAGHEEVCEATLHEITSHFIKTLEFSAFELHDHQMNEHIKHFVHQLYTHSEEDIKRMLEITVFHLKHTKISEQKLDKLYDTFIDKLQISPFDLDDEDLNKVIENFVDEEVNEDNKIQHIVAKKTKKIDVLKKQEHHVPDHVKRHFEEKIQKLRKEIFGQIHHLKHSDDHEHKPHKAIVPKAHAAGKHKHQHDKNDIKKLLHKHIQYLKNKKLDKDTLDKVFHTFTTEVNIHNLNNYELNNAAKDFVKRIEKLEAKAPLSKRH